MAENKPDLDEELPDDAGEGDGEDEQSQPVQGDDGESEGADETGELDEDQEQEEVDAAPKGRAQSRIRALSSTAREASERAAAAERRAQDLEARLAKLEQPAPKPEREVSAEEMALWTADQIVDYKLGKATKGLDDRIAQLQFQTWDSGDKAGWSGYCANEPRASRMAAAVEERLQQLRSKGILNWTRGDVYLRLLGERLSQQGTKAATTQRQEGKQRIARQRTNSGSPKGDQSGDRRRELSEKEARDRRLKEQGFIV